MEDLARSHPDIGAGQTDLVRFGRLDVDALLFALRGFARPTARRAPVLPRGGPLRPGPRVGPAPPRGPRAAVRAYISRKASASEGGTYMSDADSGRPGLRQLLWIAAGVAVLTLLVVAASWLFSPRPSPGDAGVRPRAGRAERGAGPEGDLQPRDSGGPPGRPGDRAGDRPGIARDAGPAARGARRRGPAARSRNRRIHRPRPPPPKPENPAPKDAPAAPKAEPESEGSPASDPRRFGVQVGAFTEQSKAKEVASRLEVAPLHGRHPEPGREVQGRWPRASRDRASAEKAQEALAKAGIRDPFIVPLE